MVFSLALIFGNNIFIFFALIFGGIIIFSFVVTFNSFFFLLNLFDFRIYNLIRQS